MWIKCKHLGSWKREAWALLEFKYRFYASFEGSLANKHLWADTDHIFEATGCFQWGQHSEITGESSFLLSTGQQFHFLLSCTALLFMPLTICSFLSTNYVHGQHLPAFLGEQILFVVWLACGAEELMRTALWKNLLRPKCSLIRIALSKWRVQ